MATKTIVCTIGRVTMNNQGGGFQSFLQFTGDGGVNQTGDGGVYVSPWQVPAAFSAGDITMNNQGGFQGFQFTGDGGINQIVCGSYEGGVNQIVCGSYANAATSAQEIPGGEFTMNNQGDFQGFQFTGDGGINQVKAATEVSINSSVGGATEVSVKSSVGGAATEVSVKSSVGGAATEVSVKSSSSVGAATEVSVKSSVVSINSSVGAATEVSDTKSSVGATLMPPPLLPKRFSTSQICQLLNFSAWTIAGIFAAFVGLIVVVGEF